MAEVKICGLREPEHVHVAAEAGARYLGYVFFAASPRAVTPKEARVLALEVPPGVAKVGLFVDPSDRELGAALDLVPLDFLQIHKVGDAKRLEQISTLAGLPLIIALSVSSAQDIACAKPFEEIADILLFDAKPPKGSVLPGGNGHPFDWSLLEQFRSAKPWMLAGGLTPETVREALAATGAPIVDVSSGVETAPGQKDSALIERFIRAARENRYGEQKTQHLPFRPG